MIQIRNFPSVPDLATEARFEKKLQKKNAVGMILGYYYDINGNFIQSDSDYAIQIPIESIRKTKNVIGIINARVNKNAAIGALNTGLFSHIIISEAVSSEI
ncbi:sugar-binding domain-containing protein [Peptacetobacter hominis]|uniref:sugar-binding domain-containing protein n=1 Tax=Peptacetobacter hominis TaxID=2743610 RepID=UPI001157EB70|nr:sugar-binding domain-containing protein [Peptacetobacter hominis]